MVVEKNATGWPDAHAGSAIHRLETRFQPIFSVLECALAGHEALVRPVNASGKPVGPQDFLASCARDDLPGLDRRLRRTHLARFVALDDGEGMLHLNAHPVAARGDPGAAADLREALADRGLAASRVCVEVREDDGSRDEELAEAVAAYRRLGFKVAVDDFGFRHADVDRVARLGVDFVKLDRSLLGGVARGERPVVGLTSTVRRLQEAGMAVVIEGIEEAVEACQAIDAGADFLQGYFLGVPLNGLDVDPIVGKLVCEMKRRSRGLPR